MAEQVIADAQSVNLIADIQDVDFDSDQDQKQQTRILLAHQIASASRQQNKKHQQQVQRKLVDANSAKKKDFLGLLSTPAEPHSPKRLMSPIRRKDQQSMMSSGGGPCMSPPRATIAKESVNSDLVSLFKRKKGKNGDQAKKNAPVQTLKAEQVKQVGKAEIKAQRKKIRPNKKDLEEINSPLSPKDVKQTEKYSQQKEGAQNQEQKIEKEPHKNVKKQLVRLKKGNNNNPSLISPVKRQEKRQLSPMKIVELRNNEIDINLKNKGRREQQVAVIDGEIKFKDHNNLSQNMEGRTGLWLPVVRAAQRYNQQGSPNQSQPEVQAKQSILKSIDRRNWNKLQLTIMDQVSVKSTNQGLSPKQLENLQNRYSFKKYLETSPQQNIDQTFLSQVNATQQHHQNKQVTEIQEFSPVKFNEYAQDGEKALESVLKNHKLQGQNIEQQKLNPMRRNASKKIIAKVPSALNLPQSRSKGKQLAENRKIVGGQLLCTHDSNQVQLLRDDQNKKVQSRGQDNEQSDLHKIETIIEQNPPNTTDQLKVRGLNQQKRQLQFAQDDEVLILSSNGSYTQDSYSSAATFYLPEQDEQFQLFQDELNSENDTPKAVRTRLNQVQNKMNLAGANASQQMTIRQLFASQIQPQKDSLKGSWRNLNKSYLQEDVPKLKLSRTKLKEIYKSVGKVPTPLLQQNPFMNYNTSSADKGAIKQLPQKKLLSQSPVNNSSSSKGQAISLAPKTRQPQFPATFEKLQEKNSKNLAAVFSEQDRKVTISVIEPSNVKFQQNKKQRYKVDASEKQHQSNHLNQQYILQQQLLLGGADSNESNQRRLVSKVSRLGNIVESRRAAPPHWVDKIDPNAYMRKPKTLQKRNSLLGTVIGDVQIKKSKRSRVNLEKQIKIRPIEHELRSQDSAEYFNSQFEQSLTTSVPHLQAQGSKFTSLNNSFTSRYQQGEFQTSLKQINDLDHIVNRRNSSKVYMHDMFSVTPGSAQSPPPHIASHITIPTVLTEQNSQQSNSPLPQSNPRHPQNQNQTVVISSSRIARQYETYRKQLIHETQQPSGDRRQALPSIMAPPSERYPIRVKKRITRIRVNPSQFMEQQPSDVDENQSVYSVKLQHFDNQSANDNSKDRQQFQQYAAPSAGGNNLEKRSKGGVEHKNHNNPKPILTRIASLDLNNMERLQQYPQQVVAPSDRAPAAQANDTQWSGKQFKKRNSQTMRPAQEHVINNSSSDGDGRTGSYQKLPELHHVHSGIGASLQSSLDLSNSQTAGAASPMSSRNREQILVTKSDTGDAPSGGITIGRFVNLNERVDQFQNNVQSQVAQKMNNSLEEHLERLVHRMQKQKKAELVSHRQVQQKNGGVKPHHAQLPKGTLQEVQQSKRQTGKDKDGDVTTTHFQKKQKAQLNVHLSSPEIAISSPEEESDNPNYTSDPCANGASSPIASQQSSHLNEHPANNEQQPHLNMWDGQDGPGEDSTVFQAKVVQQQQFEINSQQLTSKKEIQNASFDYAGFKEKNKPEKGINLKEYRAALTQIAQSSIPSHIVSPRPHRKVSKDLETPVLRPMTKKKRIQKIYDEMKEQMSGLQRDPSRDYLQTILDPLSPQPVNAERKSPVKNTESSIQESSYDTKTQNVRQIIKQKPKSPGPIATRTVNITSPENFVPYVLDPKFNEISQTPEQKPTNNLSMINTNQTSREHSDINFKDQGQHSNDRSRFGQRNTKNSQADLKQVEQQIQYNKQDQEFSNKHLTPILDEKVVYQMKDEVLDSSMVNKVIKNIVQQKSAKTRGDVSRSPTLEKIVLQASAGTGETSTDQKEVQRQKAIQLAQRQKKLQKQRNQVQHIKINEQQHLFPTIKKITAQQGLSSDLIVQQTLRDNQVKRENARNRPKNGAATQGSANDDLQDMSLLSPWDQN